MTPTPPQAPPKPRFDLQDAFIVFGAVALLAGIALKSVPAALITLGILCFAAAALIERSKRAPKTEG
jgi:hypothetical protein